MKIMSEQLYQLLTTNNLLNVEQKGCTKTRAEATKRLQRKAEKYVNTLDRFQKDVW